MTLPLVAIGMAATGCSDDDRNEDAPATGDAIEFTAVAERPSRTVGTTTATLKEFYLYAFTDGKPYRENVKVVKDGGAWSYTPPMYWPATPVNFYAYSPDISKTATTMPDGSGTIDNYSNPGNVDLLYAVTMNQTVKPTPVTLNFRHALSNVAVMLSSGNADIKVDVAHVSLCNVALKGDFTFPDATTAIDNDTKGVWSDLSGYNSPLIFYSHAHTDDLTVSVTPVNVTENNLDVSYMIPQPLTEVSKDDTGYKGNYITVDCRIFDAATGTKLWPNSSTPSTQLVAESDCGRLVFPLTTSTIKAWEQGYAYVYNITINNPEELDEIDFDVTVDEYK